MVTATGGVERWRLIWMFLQTFIVLHPVLTIASPGDFTSVHLAKYLNKSVSPCADFHRHVCSIGTSRHVLPIGKSEGYYDDLARDASSTKNKILNDYISEQQKENKESCIFNAQSYKSELGKRCGSLLECYLEELNYFFHLYTTSEGNKTDSTLQKYVSNANRTDIPKIMEVTSKIIDKLVKTTAPKDLEELMIIFTNLQKRLTIMSSSKDNRAEVVEKFYGVDKIRKAENNIKKEIGSRFMETPWLNETNEFGLDLLSQYLTTLSDLRIVADFDKLGDNLWRNIDRLMTEKYFEYGKRSTGCALFDVMHPIVTLVTGILNNEDPVMLGFAGSIGACNSGNQTLNEDGPDLEGLRVGYELLKHTYTKEQLQEVEYEDLGFTRKQAYFYAYAVRECHGNGDHNLVKHTDEHSASNIRINAALALMPEFTEAFGCQKGDMQYSEQSTSCYLFGPLAGTDRQAKIEKTVQKVVEEDSPSI